MSRELLVEHGAFPVPAGAREYPESARPIVARISPGVVGIRASMADGVEVVEIGLPELPDFLHFKPFDDVSAQPNAVSSALHEIILRRGVRRVRFSQQELWPCVRKALASTGAEALLGTHAIARREFRPAFAGLACEPGDHWSAFLDTRAKLHA